MPIRIKEYREAKGISQEQLAEISGVSRTIISLLETGKTTVTTNSTMKKIAAALGEKVSTIFFNE